MKREDLADLTAFVAVADAGNFTKAAVQLGVSQSAVSHTIRRLEASLGFKLLNRTSRNVSTTDAGAKLLATLRPGLDQISARIEELRSLGDAPRGLLRITSSMTGARTVLWPVVSAIVRDYPDVRIEINTDSRVSDLAEDRFDAAVRLGETVGPDMIAVPAGPLLRMAAVASPAYFARRGVPQHPDDLDDHDCLTMRFSSNSVIYDWEFERDDQEIVKRVTGPFVFNESDFLIEAACDGYGIAFVTEPEIRAAVANGSLRRVLEDWCPPFSGFKLCYSGRRQTSSALRLLIDRLRYRG